jgi:GxxExxY protein
MTLLHEDKTYKIIGAAIEVHKNLGMGFLEAVYQEALEKEFILQGIPYQREASFLIYYKNELLNKTYIADFVCYNNIIVELKAVQKLTGEHQSQVMNYLKASKMEIGLLFNFGSKSLEHKRIILTDSGDDAVIQGGVKSTDNTDSTD